MDLVPGVNHIDVQGRNYWPLVVPPACIVLWWPILAVAFNAHVATIFVIIASCLLAIAVALAVLADTLGIEDELLHGDEAGFRQLDEPDDSQEVSR